jgi:2-hydroxycyclohexanecarboxyl-CoA dehydrogenase
MNRVALVTGGSSGIGAAISERLASDGLEVVLSGLDRDEALDRAKLIGARSIVLDVADHEATTAAIQALGPVDVLINNAGIDHTAWFTDVPHEVWKRLLAVNLEGVLTCTQAVLPGMQRSGWGRIVTIGSEAGRFGSKANAVYAAAKGAVIAFSQSIAAENARFAITANVVAPGPIETPLLRQMPPAEIERVVARTQMRRLGTPAEVAAAVAFLASDEASYITGETLGVSGGMTLGG